MDKFNAREWAESIESFGIPRLTIAAKQAENELNDCRDWQDKFGHPHGLLPDAILYSVGKTCEDADRFLKTIGDFIKHGWAHHVYENGPRHRKSHLGVEMLPAEGLVAPKIRSRYEASNRHRYSIAQSTRINVYHRDNFTCQLCGDSVLNSAGQLYSEGSSWAAVLDHVVPFSMGGNNKMDNLQTAHHWCNMVRGNRPDIDKRILVMRVINRLSFQGAAWSLVEDSGDPLEPSLSNYDTSMFTRCERDWFMEGLEARRERDRAA